MNEIKLGKKYKDTLTGFAGVATGQASYLYQKPTVHLEAAIDEKGVARDQWIDAERLVEIPGPEGC